MHKRFLFTAASAVGIALLPIGVAARAGPPPTVPPNGPHGCFLADLAGISPPVVHQSDTSTIGGSNCTYVQVASDPSMPQGGSYFAFAASWSIVAQKYACHTDHKHHKHCNWVADRTADFSSAAGSPNVGQYVIPIGDKLTVRVGDGVIISGTPNGAPGA